MSDELRPVTLPEVPMITPDSDAEAIAARVRYLFRMVEGSPAAAELQAMVLAYRLEEKGA